MPKVKISEYSATANSNTDVASINIDEGCAPSGINNAIRAVMGHLKDFQQGTYGDPFNGPVNGTLGATTASTAVVTTLNSTDATDASSTTAAAMKTAGGLGVAKKMFVGLDANIYGLTVGRGAGAVATNTAVGASALAANTTGAGNVAVGQNALLSNTTANYNNAFGTASLYSNTTGTNNVAMGDASLFANTTGSNNTSIGATALRFNTTASGNTAVGQVAAYSNTTGSGITAVGYQVLYANTTGVSNTGIGGADATNSIPAALTTNSTGSYNVAVGTGALKSNTTASNNTAVGYQAGYTNTTGTGGVFVGRLAGYTSNAAYCTYIGEAAGYVATGISNTFVGNGSGGAVTSGTKNTILGMYNGNQGGLDIRTASNYIVLSDGDGNPRGIFDGSGNLLVGGTTSYGGKIQGISTYIRSANGTSSQNVGFVASDLASNEWHFGRSSVDGYYYVVRQTGTGMYMNTNAWVATSDIRAKENIVPLESSLAKINSLNPVRFTFKKDGMADVGFIAQEMYEQIPEVVDKPEDEEAMMGISKEKIIPFLVKAIQELKAEVDSLKAQINGASA